jgi:hypothetical protein
MGRGNVRLLISDCFIHVQSDAGALRCFRSKTSMQHRVTCWALLDDYHSARPWYLSNQPEDLLQQFGPSLGYVMRGLQVSVPLVGLWGTQHAKHWHLRFL